MLSVSGMYGGEMTEKWSYLAFASGSTAFENGAVNSYLSGILIGGGMYTSTDALNLIAGAGVLYLARLKWGLKILTVSWTICPKCFLSQY